MMMRAKMKMMMMIASMNVHNSLMMNQDIEIFESMFDLLRFVNNEIREMMIVQMRFDRFESFERFVDLMMIAEVEIEHFEIESLENESMQ
jgi:hypothetical protein